MQIGYLDLENSVGNNERENFLNQGEVTLQVHTQLINSLSNREIIKDIINDPSIHTTLLISVMNVMVRNKMRASDVDRRIISSQIFRN